LEKRFLSSIRKLCVTFRMTFCSIIGSTSSTRQIEHTASCIQFCARNPPLLDRSYRAHGTVSLHVLPRSWQHSDAIPSSCSSLASVLQ
jgi:hypothetical protein